jgi:hypothetical protein
MEAQICTDIEAIDEDSGGVVSWTEVRASGSKRLQQKNLPNPA